VGLVNGVFGRQGEELSSLPRFRMLFIRVIERLNVR